MICETTAMKEGITVILSAHLLILLQIFYQLLLQQSLNPNSKSYVELLERVKRQIRTAQVGAALAVNQQLVLLYWGIGKEILQRQASEGWGSKVVDRLAQDLRAEFSEMKGLSRTNLLYMRSFAEVWSEESIVQQVVGRIPWGHNVRLLDW